MEVIRTPRLEGRPVRAEDADFADALLGRPEVARWTQDERAEDRATAEREGERGPEAGAPASSHLVPPHLAPSHLTAPHLAAHRLAAHWAAHGFGLRLWSAQGRPAALAGLRFCVLEGRPAVEASFAVTPERWGQGLAGEAMAAAMAEAPEICAEVQAVVRAGNLPAAALLRRLGFEERAAPAEAGRRRFQFRTGAS